LVALHRHSHIVFSNGHNKHQYGLDYAVR